MLPTTSQDPLCWDRATACQDSRLLSSTRSQGIIRYAEFIALLAALFALLQPRVIGIKWRRVAPLRLAHGSQGLLVNKKQGQCHARGGGWGSGWVPLCTSSIPTSSLWHGLSPPSMRLLATTLSPAHGKRCRMGVQTQIPRLRHRQGLAHTLPSLLLPPALPSLLLSPSTLPMARGLSSAEGSHKFPGDV